MNIDDLKNDWQQEQAGSVDLQVDADSIQVRLESMRKKILRTNIFQSVVMGLTMIFIAVIWYIYQEGRSWAFHGSIISIELLIVAMVSFFWSRTLLKSHLNLEQESLLYLKNSIRRLKRTILLTKVATPIYIVLLWISIMMYMYELMSSHMKMMSIAMAITSIYFIAVSVIGFKKQRRKQRKQIEPLIKDLEEMLVELK